MKGNDHLAVSLASGFLLVSPYPLTIILYLFSFGVGIVLGSLLPDVDAKDSKGRHFNEFSILLFDTLTFLIVPIMKPIYKWCNIDFDPKHRGSLHSLLGILMYSYILMMLVLVILLLLGMFNLIVPYFFFGLILGGIFHLMEDCCTQSGIYPFIPRSFSKYSGTISTWNKEERRPELFAGLLFVEGGAIFFANFYFGVNTLLLAAISILLFTFSWYVFFKLTKVTKEIDFKATFKQIEKFKKLGNEYYKNGKFKKAIALYNRAISLYPEYADAWCNKAMAYKKLGRIDSAKRCKEKCIKYSKQNHN